jgi:hypothetical protein
MPKKDNLSGGRITCKSMRQGISHHAFSFFESCPKDLIFTPLRLGYNDEGPVKPGPQPSCESTEPESAITRAGPFTHQLGSRHGI